jgi:hypothetical protein
MRLAWTALLLVVVVPAWAQSPTSSIWGDLVPGPYGVGVTVLDERDSTRASLTVDSVTVMPAGRPVPLVVWYPAKPAVSARISLRDYIELGAGGLGAAGFSLERRRQALLSFSADADSEFSRARIDSVIALPMQARRNVPRASGRFPLVLFLHSTPWGAAVMGEYLASHGFVVAAFQSKGAREPAYRLSRANLDAMVEDAKFAVSRMRSHVDVTTRLGVIGMSNGSIAAMALELAGLRPDAIVSLDGGIGERAGGTYLAERSMGNPARLTVPLLHLYTPDNPHLDFQYLRSYESSPRMLARVDHLRHGDFLTGGALERVMPGWRGEAPSHVTAGFATVCRYTLRFLRWRLAGDAGSERFLEQSPEANGVLEGLMEIERLPSSTDREK